MRLDREKKVAYFEDTEFEKALEHLKDADISATLTAKGDGPLHQLVASQKPSAPLSQLKKALTDATFEHSPESWESEVTESGKAAILQLFERFYEAHSSMKKPVDRVSLLADELLTNALYRSKENADGGSADPVVEFSLQFDEQSIVLSCQDSLGTLKKEHILGNLLKTGTTEGGGVGAGSQIFLEHGSDIFFCCHKNQHTFVWLRFPNSPHRRKLEPHSNLAIFVKG